MSKYFIMILALSILVPFISVVDGETKINIYGTESDISQSAQYELASKLHAWGRCDSWEGNNTRDCTITIDRIQDGNMGNLEIPGTMSINVTWMDH